MITVMMQSLHDMPDDRKDGRLLYVSDGVRHYLARWSPGREPSGGRFWCYDGGPCDLYLSPMHYWADVIEGVELVSNDVHR